MSSTLETPRPQASQAGAEPTHRPSPTSAPSDADAAPADELQPDAPPRAPEAAAAGPQPKPRGFAAIDRKLLSEIARKGGKAAHSAGTAHEFTSDEARAAGRKGGLASHAKRRAAK